MTLSRAAVFVALLPFSPAQAFERDPPYYFGFVERVVDGDSVRVVIPQWPLPRRHALIRIYGIDAPESVRGRAKCEIERQHGMAATKALKPMLPRGIRVRLRWMNESEKYGRELMRIEMPDGRDVGQVMLSLDMAMPYFGGEKPDHCTEYGFYDAPSSQVPPVPSEHSTTIYKSP